MPFDSLSLTLTLFNISSHPSLLSFRWSAVFVSWTARSAARSWVFAY
jgi:hypothetical protein